MAKYKYIVPLLNMKACISANLQRGDFKHCEHVQVSHAIFGEYVKNIKICSSFYFSFFHSRDLYRLESQMWKGPSGFTDVVAV